MLSYVVDGRSIIVNATPTLDLVKERSCKGGMAKSRAKLALLKFTVFPPISQNSLVEHITHIDKGSQSSVDFHHSNQPHLCPSNNSFNKSFPCFISILIKVHKLQTFYFFDKYSEFVLSSKVSVLDLFSFVFENCLNFFFGGCLRLNNL